MKRKARKRSAGTAPRGDAAPPDRWEEMPDRWRKHEHDDDAHGPADLCPDCRSGAERVTKATVAGPITGRRLDVVTIDDPISGTAFGMVLVPAERLRGLEARLLDLAAVLDTIVEELRGMRTRIAEARSQVCGDAHVQNTIALFGLRRWNAASVKERRALRAWGKRLMFPRYYSSPPGHLREMLGLASETDIHRLSTAQLLTRLHVAFKIGGARNG